MLTRPYLVMIQIMAHIVPVLTIFAMWQAGFDRVAVAGVAVVATTLALTIADMDETREDPRSHTWVNEHLLRNLLYCGPVIVIICLAIKHGYRP